MRSGDEKPCLISFCRRSIGGKICGSFEQLRVWEKLVKKFFDFRVLLKSPAWSDHRRSPDRVGGQCTRQNASMSRRYEPPQQHETAGLGQTGRRGETKLHKLVSPRPPYSEGCVCAPSLISRCSAPFCHFALPHKLRRSVSRRKYDFYPARQKRAPRCAGSADWHRAGLS